jgi:uncharacterized NAD(P)/FAD-binding protein YdhS
LLLVWKGSEMKKIRVMIEIPEDWIDYDDPVFGLGHYVSDRLQPLLREAVIDKALAEMKIPKISITKEEIKDRMLTILAEKALEER